MPAAAGAGYGVNAKAKNRDLALKFVTYVMSPAGMKLFNEKQGSLPTLPGSRHHGRPGPEGADHLRRGEPHGPVHGPALAQR
nr:hypothetical protein GCM10020092_073490 [Actinoplanes digitatis]